MIKFSVLIPTRNRLQYLKYAVSSVLQQDYANWEIIISDNFSEEDIESYVKSLNDPRIKYYRTTSFIPVTDNWNHSLEKCQGEYVVMLGDDDALIEGYFSTILKLLKQFDNPDLLYSSAYLYAYPQVLDQFPKGLLHKWGNAEFLEKKEVPFILDKNEAKNTVIKSFSFKVLFNFNMQFALVHRSLIDELQKYGKFYQSPYPDYYAMTALLLKAKKILAVPYPLVVVGITPKSFGYFYFNEKEEDGVSFLKNYPDENILQGIKKYVLPGTQMNTSWLIALETVKKNFRKEYPLKVKYNNYRFLQILSHFKNYAMGKNEKRKEFLKLAKDLFWWEKLMYIPSLVLFAKALNMYSSQEKREDFITKWVSSFSHPPYTMVRIEKDFDNVLDICKNLKYTGKTENQ